MATSTPRRGNKVRVAARLRPFIPGEGGERCVTVSADKVLLAPLNGPPEPDLEFCFDRCFGEAAGHGELFDTELAPVLGAVLDGYNGTVLCYGVTGSGKTHTMDGLVPAAVQHCLATPGLAARLSYFEILNERVLDLLAPGQPELQVREGPDGKVHLPGATELRLESNQQFGELRAAAAKNRATAHTNANTASSRSHAVLRLRLEHNGQAGLLHLIDLAGSEDNRVTGNTGQRLVESANINSSLLALGKVIDALNSRAKHVPYRDSKLTRVLQDSLGGAAHTLMIVNLAPGLAHHHHVLNTLQFAAKSRNILNRPPELQPANQPTPSMADRLALFREKKGLTPRGTPGGSAHKKRPREATPGPGLKLAKLLEPRQPLASQPPNSYLGGGGALLLTPQSKLKQAKQLVATAVELETAGDCKAALAAFEAAAAVVPSEELAQKIQKLAGCEPEKPGSSVRAALDQTLLAALNSGCRERLNGLKDIGPKRAEKVLELVREAGPLAEVGELSKIGMSQKQVDNFLKRNVLMSV